MNKLNLTTQNPLLVDAAKKLATSVQKLAAHSSQLKARALIVGGFVRDTLLDVVSDDLDMEVYGVSAEDLQALLEKLYPKTLDLIGRSFGIFHVTLKNGLDVEIAIPRSHPPDVERERGFGRHQPGLDVVRDRAAHDGHADLESGPHHAEGFRVDLGPER